MYSNVKKCRFLKKKNGHTDRNLAERDIYIGDNAFKGYY